MTQSLLQVPLTIGGGLLLFTIPGLAALRWLYQEPLLWFERLAFATSLSCVVMPLLLLFSELIGWRWHSGSAWVLLAVLAIIAFWPPHSHRSTKRSHRHLIGWIVVSLTIAALAVRLFVVRTIPVGLFGDSYHHTVITQLLIDHGGLFHS
ncbi:MAG: hypothetical protein D6716_08260, partial [Chloroflexi bacterium]